MGNKLYSQKMVVDSSDYSPKSQKEIEKEEEELEKAIEKYNKDLENFYSEMEKKGFKSRELSEEEIRNQRLFEIHMTKEISYDDYQKAIAMLEAIRTISNRYDHKCFIQIRSEFEKYYHIVKKYSGLNTQYWQPSIETEYVYTIDRFTHPAELMNDVKRIIGDISKFGPSIY